MGARFLLRVPNAGAGQHGEHGRLRRAGVDHITALKMSDRLRLMTGLRLRDGGRRQDRKGHDNKG